MKGTLTEFSLILNLTIRSLAIRSATNSDTKVLDLTLVCHFLISLIIPLQTNNIIPVCDLLVIKFEAWSESTNADVNTGSPRCSGICGGY